MHTDLLSNQVSQSKVSKSEQGESNKGKFTNLQVVEPNKALETYKLYRQ